MAEIETKRSAGKKKRFNKRSTRVDLTPMVDLGFLLLTFFVFTTSMTTPTAMNLVMPYDKDTTTHDPVCESCVLTVLLDKQNRIQYYAGSLEQGAEVKETGFAASEIRSVLMHKKAAVQRARGDGDQFILIIKPSAKSSFKNFVDITDEVSICGIKKYYIDELKAADKQLLMKNE